jgi:hypothetical protein
MPSWTAYGSIADIFKTIWIIFKNLIFYVDVKMTFSAKPLHLDLSKHFLGLQE